MASMMIALLSRKTGVKPRRNVVPATAGNARHAAAAALPVMSVRLLYSPLQSLFSIAAPPDAIAHLISVHRHGKGNLCWCQHTSLPHISQTRPPAARTGVRCASEIDADWFFWAARRLPAYRTER